jgi:Uma2 family endonuclease
MKALNKKPKTDRSRKNGQLGQPAWAVAELFPRQGNWTVDEYFDLPGNRLVEFSHGFIEVLPVPTTSHQYILLYILRLLDAFVSARRLGLALPAGVRVQLWPQEIREPDLVFMLREHKSRIGEEFWQGADLVMEVVSGDPKDRRRDLIKKRAEYARARITEYWIIDPRLKRITVLRLKGRAYVVHGEFGPSTIATSHLLTGFSVDVDEAFASPLAQM